MKDNKTVDEIPPIVQRRKIEGISAILLPFADHDAAVDWDSFDASVARTLDAGLVPAVNMDTGYANLISEDVRQTVLDRTRAICAGQRFTAGAFVGDSPGAAFSKEAYGVGIDSIQSAGGQPIIFQSYGLTQQTDEQIVSSYRWFGEACDQFIGFELGTMFAPFGKVYDLEVVRGIMDVPSCVGVKHSSLDRVLEWQRLRLRNEVRPDFKIYTGNDLAIDMVMYGSDYLLGLSAFCPALFQQRDKMWLVGDPRFYQLNDVLQYLGAFGFRVPVPAYKHTAAMFLKMQGLIANDFTHPKSATRPDSDREILQQILEMTKAFR